MCDNCDSKMKNYYDEVSESEIMTYSNVRTISARVTGDFGTSVGSGTAPKGLHLDAKLEKLSKNNYRCHIAFWHYKREYSSWETWNAYGQNLIIEKRVGGGAWTEILRYNFKFGNGNPTYHYPNTLYKYVDVTITANTEFRFRTTCSWCESGTHREEYNKFNFIWGIRTAYYENPQIIPGTPSASVTFTDNRTFSYNGVTVYPGANTATFYGATGSNGKHLSLELNFSTDMNAWGIPSKSDFNVTYNNTGSKSITVNWNDNDRCYWRFRVVNYSETGHSSTSSWIIFKLNALPTISGSITTSEDSTSSTSQVVMYNGLNNVTLPTANDAEGQTKTYEVYYRLKHKTGNWGNWTLYTTTTNTSLGRIEAESLMSMSYYIQFGLKYKDVLEYGSSGNIVCLSKEYLMNDNPPPKGEFENIVEGSVFLNEIIPTIKNNSIFDAHRSIYKVEYYMDGRGPIISKYEEVINPDTNEVLTSFYSGTNITSIGNHTGRTKVTNIKNGLSTDGDNVNFSIIEPAVVIPIIMGDTNGGKIDTLKEGGTYYEVVPYCKPDSNVSSFRGYLSTKQTDGSWSEESPFIFNQLINTVGTYKLRAEATHKVTGQVGESSIIFNINNDTPGPIEVYGVVEGDIKASFEIHIIKQNNVTMSIYLNGKIISSTDSQYEGRNSHMFRVTVEGDYSLRVVGTHNISTLTREFNINRFTVRKGAVNTDIVRFRQPSGPVHSTQVLLHSGDHVLNKIEYEVNGSDRKYYSSPILIFDNEIITGYDTNRANVTQPDTKRFDGFIAYKPEIPKIIGVEDGGVYKTPVNIKFQNIASKPNQAMYKIFLDGDDLTDPFKTSGFDLNKNGYHTVTILGWDNINPYAYSFKTIRFLIKIQNNKTIRNPYIILYDNEKDKFVDAKVKFSSVSEDFVHRIKITELDGSFKETSYHYNIKTVNLKIKNNCYIEAFTSLPEMGIERRAVATVNTIFDVVPPSENVHILGVNKYPITDGNEVRELNIGKNCIIEIDKQRNEEYEVYINGYPYTLGTIIENRGEELKKYTVEIIITNTTKNLKSYYSNEFILDSINPAFPTLLNLTPNLMNKERIPKNIEMKNDDNMSDEDFILNNRIVNIKTETIKKDDEYILVVTYTYYNGAKRTNSFYFSINSNPIDELSPLRLELKLLDYRNSHLAKEGELIIDRHTGHIYYKNGTIRAITKTVEDVILNIEKQLIKIESNHDLMQGLQFFFEDVIESVNNKQVDFTNRLESFETKLDTIIADIEKTKQQITNLENEFNDIDGYVSNIVNVITITKANAIKTLTNDCKTLNNNFIKLNEEMREIFNRASICTQETYWLKDEIATRVTTSDFEQWKKDEEAKYQAFLQKLRDYGVGIK